MTEGRLVHVTTSDMSLVLLLGPQLRAFANAGFERRVTGSCSGRPRRFGSRCRRPDSWSSDCAVAALGTGPITRERMCDAGRRKAMVAFDQQQVIDTTLDVHSRLLSRLASAAA